MKRALFFLLILSVLGLSLTFASSAGITGIYGPNAGVLTYTGLAGGDTGDPDGGGYVNIAFDRPTLNMCYILSITNIGSATGAHIHRVSDDSVFVPLTDANGTPGTCQSITSEQMDELTANPANFYVNIHNEEFPGGAISGTLGFVPVLSTVLTGEASNADLDGYGGAAFAFYPDQSSICYFASVTGLSTTTAAHIHTGGVNQNGGPLVTLTAPSPDIVNCSGVTESTQNEILANPEGYYVNVHTDEFPGGAIRGQLGSTTLLHATTLGLNEVSNTGVLGVGDPDGYGLALVNIDMGLNQICYNISVSNVDTAFTGAHIHSGSAGTNGGVTVALTPPDATGNVVDCVNVDVNTLSAILSFAPEYYVNIHNGIYPAGAVRGQIESYQTFSATLSGEAEVDGSGTGGQGDPDGYGRALVHISANDNNICYTIDVNEIAQATAAHIHGGVAGSNGGVVVGLTAPDAGGTVTMCDNSQQLATLASVAAAPWAHYVNVHNADYPGGAVRGQLNVYEVFTAVMTGDQEVPGPGDPDGYGVGTYGFNFGNSVVCSTMQVDNIATATAAHIHTGAVGIGGGVLFPLPTPNESGFAAACSEIAQGSIDAVLANPEGYYANVHNAEYPPGAVRGQLTQFPEFPLAPSSFALIGPADGSVVYDFAALLSITWEESSGATEYQWTLLQISTNSRIGLIQDLTLTPEGEDDALTCTAGVCELSLPIEALSALPDGQYSWTVIARSLLGEEEASNAPFGFIVASDGVELVANGGFEENDGKRPMYWTLRNISRDRVRCNTDTKSFSFEGDCAWSFRGSATERSRIIQDVDLSGIVTDSETLLGFSAFINGNSNATRGKARVIVSYADGVTPNDKIVINFGATSGYELIEDALALKGEASRIRVIFQYRGSAGKVYVDAVSAQINKIVPLTLTEQNTMPLPAAPSDFRSGN